MIKASWVVLALAGATSTAPAQPGNTPPMPPPAGAPPEGAPPPQAAPPPQGMPPPYAPPPGAPPQSITGMQVGPVDVDQVISNVAARAPAIERMASNAFRRARRAISVGPTVGF